MIWNDEKKFALETMWLWGVSSSGIAASLDMQRNAVMGKVNRLGLMGRGGERLGMANAQSGLDQRDVAQAVADLIGEPYDPSRRVHLNAAVTVAALFTGRHADMVGSTVGQPAASVEQAFDDLHETGVWRRGKPPPNAWWHHQEGQMAFLLDMMASSGVIAIANPEVRDTSQRSYYRPE